MQLGRTRQLPSLQAVAAQRIAGEDVQPEASPRGVVAAFLATAAFLVVAGALLPRCASAGWKMDGGALRHGRLPKA